MTLTPAYGRDYRSPRAVVKDLESSVKFIRHRGQVSETISVGEIPSGTKCKIKFDRLNRVVTYIKP